MRYKYHMTLPQDTIDVRNLEILRTSPKDGDVSEAELSVLLKGRKFVGDLPTDPQIQVVNPIEVKELEEFCIKHGIIGVNFGNVQSPKRMLEMLKARMGYKESTTSQKGLLYG